MANAYGARSVLGAAFEDNYGVPARDFTRMPFAQASLSSSQELLDSELLGYGRDPLPPVPDAVSVEGSVEVPVGAEDFGYWLKATFGEPTTTTVPATGEIVFSANPRAGDTITLGGATWTFVSGSAGAQETSIEDDLEATLLALTVDLNGASDPRISAATYSAEDSALVVEHSTAGSEGNDFTLAASSAQPSGRNLTGGGYRHEFRTGLWDLPALTLEVGIPEVPRYAVYSGVMIDKLSWAMQRSGLMTASIDVVAKQESIYSASQAESVEDLELRRFGHFNGCVGRNGQRLGNVVSAQIDYSNNLDRIETICSGDGIDGADPTIAALTGSIDVRFADMTLINQALDGGSCELSFRYVRPSGEVFLLTAHSVFLPRPSVEISGPQGIQVTFDWQAALDTTTGRMATVHLINNIAGY